MRKFRCRHPQTPENVYTYVRKDNGNRVNTCRACRVRGWRRSEYKQAGWTLAEYENAYKAQGGLCAICEQPEQKPGRYELSVDHDHTKPLGAGQRALLCDNCNRMLGNAKDDPSRLIRAAEYLINYGAGICQV